MVLDTCRSGDSICRLYTARVSQVGKTDTLGDNPANRTLIINWGVMENMDCEHRSHHKSSPSPPQAFSRCGFGNDGSRRSILQSRTGSPGSSLRCAGIQKAARVPAYSSFRILEGGSIQGRLSKPPSPPAMRSVRCVRYGTISRLLPNFCDLKSCRFAGRKAAMENYRVDELRAELGQLLKKQAEVLESRSLGAATDTELLEYEIRQEIVHEICNQLAHSISE